MVDIHVHKCFIQPHVDEPEEEKVDDDDGQGKKKPLYPLLFVYADIEAMQLPNRQFEHNMLCCCTHESANIMTHKGKDCVNTFLRDLMMPQRFPMTVKERSLPFSIT